MVVSFKKLVQNMPNSELVKTAKICMSDTTTLSCPVECPFTDSKFDCENVVDEGRACWDWIFVELAERLGNVDLAYERGYFKGHEDATRHWANRDNYLGSADI